ncbi:MAG: PAS domain-containing protein [Oscillospiraceae bacterium]|nr:PAS domain-containing protein [Oscillospiraceae bacterium]
MTEYFKSVLDQDVSPVVICDLQHRILYMNPVAVTRYAGAGGEKLIGKSLMDCHDPCSRERIRQVLNWFAEDSSHNRIHTFHNEKENKDVYMVALRSERGELIGYYEKHEYRNREKRVAYEALA